MISKRDEWETSNYTYEVKIKYVLYRSCSFKNLDNSFKYTPHLLRNIKNQGNVTMKYTYYIVTSKVLLCNRSFPLFCLAVHVF